MKRFQRLSHQSGFILLPVVFTLALLAAVAYLLNREGAINAGNVNHEHQKDTALYTAQAGYNHAIWQLNRKNCTGYTDIPVTSLGQNSYSVSFTDTTGAALSSGSPANIKVVATQANGASYTLQRYREKVYQYPPQQLVLQPDATAGKDTYLYEWKPTWNYGLDNSLMVDNEFNLSEYRSLLQFDLTALPTTKTTIKTARLALYQNSPSVNGGDIAVYKVTRTWTEGSKTGGVGAPNWTQSDAAVNWTTAGGDYASTAVAITTVAGGVANVWYQWDISSLVQDWADGTSPNYGVILAAASEKASAYFYSSDYTDPVLRPKLTIEYVCECGQTCTTTSTACSTDYIPNVKIGAFSTTSYGSDNIKGLSFLPEGSVFNGISAPAGGAWISVNDNVDSIFMTDISGGLLTSVTSPFSKPTGIAFVTDGIHAGQFAMTDYSAGGIAWVDSNGTLLSTIADTIVNLVGVSYIQKTVSSTYDNTFVAIDSNSVVYFVDQSGTIMKTLDASAFTASVEDITHVPNTDKLLIIDRALLKVIIVDFNGTQLSNYSIASFGAVTPNDVGINPLTCDHAIADLGADQVIALNNSEAVNALTLGTKQDTQLSFKSNVQKNNYGAANSMGVRTGSNAFNSLVMFDVSAIPAGKLITSATLRLNATLASSLSAQPKTIAAYKLSRAWTEGSKSGAGPADGATWLTYNGSTNWTTAGGDYEATLVATATEESSGLSPPPASFSGGWLTWDLKALVQEWVDGVSSNYGLILISSVDDWYTFDTKESGNANEPHLVVTYE